MSGNKKNQVIKWVWDVVQPLKLARPFSRVARGNAYRDHELMIDVLSMEFFDAATHRAWGTTTHSFGLSCGIFLRFAPNPFGGRIAEDGQGNLQPDATVCAIRSHLFAGLSQPKNVPRNVWFVRDDLSNLDEIARDAARAIEGLGLAWFERFHSLDAILHVLKDAEEDIDGRAPCFGFGRKGSPVRNLYLGFTALKKGARAVALEALTAATSKGGFAQLSGSDEVDRRIEQELGSLGSREHGDVP